MTAPASPTPADALAADIDQLRVDLGPRAYDIVIGEDLLSNAGRYIGPVLTQPRTVVITDDVVAPLHLATLEQALEGAGIAHQSIVLPAGEQTKDFDHLRDLIDTLLDGRIERSTTLVALGGGVIGDIAGFAAAVTLRGLPFVQIPTTLLAQVDSSVGGKTGIDTRQGKNLVGAFHQPQLVLADIAILDTLPRRQILAGYAEVVKYGLIDRPGFFSWLEENGRAFLDGDRAARRHVVIESCRAKAEVVAADEREAGRRALLNLGHTFAHALEAETEYGGKLLHGEAVSIGLVLAFDLSVRLGLCPREDALRARRHLEGMDMPTGLDGIVDTSWTTDALIAHMGLDKKVSAGRITFVLLRGIGKAFISHEVDMDVLRAVLDTALEV